MRSGRPYNSRCTCSNFSFEAISQEVASWKTFVDRKKFRPPSCWGQDGSPPCGRIEAIELAQQSIALDQISLITASGSVSLRIPVTAQNPSVSNASLGWPCHCRINVRYRSPQMLRKVYLVAWCGLLMLRVKSEDVRRVCMHVWEFRSILVISAFCLL